MNWTGGRLQRHSRNSAGKSLNYTQKQHFAKVRNRLQNWPRAVSPLDFSLLHAARERREDSKSMGEDGGLEGRPKRQKTLGEYGSTAALVNRLSALRSTNISHRRGTASELRRRTQQPAPANSKDFSSAQYDVAAGPRVTKAPNATPRDHMDDLRNQGHEKGLRLKSESSRANIFPFISARGNRSATESQSLEDKRQALLRQGDWVCTAITRPLKFSFPISNYREKVGRRRKIYREVRTDRVLPAYRPYQPPSQERLLPQKRSWENRDGREDISVRIGGQVHGSQRTIFRGAGEALSQRQQHSMSSESMLLDREDRWYGAQDPVGLFHQSDLLGTESQYVVPEDALWPSRTNSATSSASLSSSAVTSDGIEEIDELQPEVYQFANDEDEDGYRYNDDECSQASPKSSAQRLGLQPETDIADDASMETTDASANSCIEDRVGLHSGDDNIIEKDGDDLVSRVLGIEPVRLILDSTSQSNITSDIKVTSKQDAQAIRSTVAEASDDTKDVAALDSDEIEWEKLIMLGNSPKSLSIKADRYMKLPGLGHNETEVVTTPASDSDEAARYQPNLELVTHERSPIIHVDEAPIIRNTTLHMEDETWMRFLDISGDTEEEDKETSGMTGECFISQFENSDESEISVSRRRPINESMLAQASSASITRTQADRLSPPNQSSAFNSEQSRPEGLMEHSSSSSPHSSIRSTVATVNTSPTLLISHRYISALTTVSTSPPDPLAASTSPCPSAAAATAYSSNSGLTSHSPFPAPPRSSMRHPKPAHSSSPDPLTLTSPSALDARHHEGQAATMQPPDLQRVIFTKPTPFTGCHVSATAIQNVSRQPLHLGRAIAGSSSRSKFATKYAKATLRSRMRNSRDKSRGAGRRATRSVYSIPSTDNESEIEDGRGRKDETESIEEDDGGLLEQI